MMRPSSWIINKWFCIAIAQFSYFTLILASRPSNYIILKLCRSMPSSEPHGFISGGGCSAVCSLAALWCYLLGSILLMAGRCLTVARPCRLMKGRIRMPNFTWACGKCHWSTSTLRPTRSRLYSMRNNHCDSWVWNVRAGIWLWRHLFSNCCTQDGAHFS